MRVGIVFGCFIPMHQGHIRMINKALQENDKIILTLCGFPDDRGKDFLPFAERWKLLQQIYGDFPNITLCCIDDKKLGLDGSLSKENWHIWAQEMFKQSGYDPEQHDYTWYTGEASYVENISPSYPGHRFVLLDRHRLPISGTMIRTNPEQYKQYIDPHFYYQIINIKRGISA